MEFKSIDRANQEAQQREEDRRLREKEAIAEIAGVAYSAEEEKDE